MRILLISPRAKTGGLESLRSGNQILQGLLYVAAAVKEAGHFVIVVHGDASDVEASINKYRPDILGLSCVTSTYPIARDTIIQAKKSFPHLKTIIGGHHATFLYQEVIEDCGVDYVCRGEGEEVFVQLIQALEKGNPYPSIEGITFFKDGSYHNDQKIAILEDLHKLPRITFDLVPAGTSFSPKIVSSRGCPFRCSFCSISAFYNGVYRQRSVEAVIEDIKTYVAAGYHSFWFHDDNLTVDTKWVYAFCDALDLNNIEITWNAMSRVDTICNNPQLIQRMAQSGCKLLSIGIESGIPEVLEKLQKRIDNEQIERAIKIMNSSKISHTWYMILGSGDEFDTPQYMEKNIRFFRSHRFGFVLVSILTPLPGTELYAKLKSEGRILHKDYSKYDIMHCVYQPLGMSPKTMESYLPKAYLNIYLGKGWRLIPLLWKSSLSGAVRPNQIWKSITTLFKTYVLGRSFEEAIRKDR